MRRNLKKTSTMFCIVPNITLSLVYKRENGSGVFEPIIRPYPSALHFLQ